MTDDHTSGPPVRILLACFAKSGSTFFSHTVAHLKDAAYVSWTPAYERREQELCERLILENEAPRQIAQHHVRASDYTLRLVGKHDMHVIVLVRNIFDTVVSLADHISKQGWGVPFAYFDERHASLPLSERLDLIIDLAVPWYVNFYASWWYFDPKLMITFEDIVLGGPGKQCAVLQRSGIDVDIDELSAAAEKAKETSGFRFNVGTKGRGETLLSDDQKARIANLCHYYPSVDFGMMGIH